jgi:mono/diheme cytochrome c family protein
MRDFQVFGLVLWPLLGLAGCNPAVTAPGAAGPTASSHIVGVAESGRAVFVEKGCVMCHAVNGVGGKAAPALDAEVGGPEIDPLDFAARMWAGAPAMIELQSLELGYMVSVTGQDIANLAAFAANIDEQRKLTADQIPEGMRDSLLDERFWEMEDWDDFLRKGQEGYEPTAPDTESGDPSPQ